MRNISINSCYSILLFHSKYIYKNIELFNLASYIEIYTTYIDYINYIQFSAINYLEYFFKKKIFLKVSNNFFKKPDSLFFLKLIFEDYKFFQPKYMKNYLISDFLELI